jgi:hypothetical protein
MGVFYPSFVVSISLNLYPSGITLFFQEQIMFHTMGMFECGTIENLSWQLHFQRYIYIFKLYHIAVTEDGGGWEWEYWHRCLLDHRVEDLLLLPAVIRVPRLAPPAYKRWVPINFLLWNCNIVSCNGNSREDCKVHVKLIYSGYVKTMDLKCSEVIRCRSNQSFAPCCSS